MSDQPPPSPPLPTFAIKDLCGPSNPPGLISISKRRYDATLKSTPNAALLYLDDDDGELITIGSSLELGQRLEEPVPRYIREFRDPTDGKLVHVFDINHTTASLVEWRDHEAYSSKHFNSLSPSLQSPSPETDPHTRSLAPTTAPFYMTYPDLSRLQEEPDCDKTSSTESPPARKIEEPFNLLDGIEQHLSGLATVLQIAADTLKRAADKTKDTDTSVVEDILKGVKGILTEVGSFGIEAFKQLDAEISTALDEQSTATSVPASDETVTVRSEDEDSTELSNVADGDSDFCSTHENSQSSDDLVQAVDLSSLDGSPIQAMLECVSSKSTCAGQSAPREASRSVPLHARSARSNQSSRLSLMEDAPPSILQSPSFLDDSSEDADFTARYPPMSTVRRTRSTIDRSLQWPNDSTEKAKAHSRYFRTLKAADREAWQSTLASCPSALSPFTSPPATISNESRSVRHSVAEVKAGNADVVQKPLPGAWPENKNESAPALPVAVESSGDFFNRMVGRHCPGRYRNFGTETGLYRANTTASSNPASRLNGPFDPGFAYNATTPSHHKPGSFRSYIHTAQINPSLPVRPAKDTRSSTTSEASLFSSPVPSVNFSTPLDTHSRCSADDPKTDFETSRTVKHYRSVPQFQALHSPPYQIMNSIPAMDNNPRRPHRSTTDFLSGPAMPMPPPMSFTTRPHFAPRYPPPNLWAPWQSSPPMQPPADEDTNVSSLRDLRPINDATSPVSSQSTTTRDFDLPSNEPPFPSGQPQFSSSPATYRYPTPPQPPPVRPYFFPPPPPPQCMQIEPVKDKIEECIDQLKMCGFGVDDENLKDRLHVYAVAADGDVTEAVEMIEEDRRMTASGRFD